MSLINVKSKKRSAHFDQAQASDQGEPLLEYQTDQLRGVNPISAGTDFRRQNLTSIDVRF